MYGIAAWGASSQLQEKNVEEMRCFEREGIMGIVTLSGSAVLQERTSTLMHQWARTLQKRDIFCCQKSKIPSHRNSEHGTHAVDGVRQQVKGVQAPLTHALRVIFHFAHSSAATDSAS
jgi:hypothetical protein